ncbi:hypothetical protein Afil01_46320 [Actinorhabdospora filicis]|uniref:Uncharacterized protein n=1 Tax=Actinorhabdospora filicis TaxID=1785913 RepID=A0A9W6SMV4_9ACTN|nr:hypothetical protein Afil01_46320 [Actinorhabdospora filicis]
MLDHDRTCILMRTSVRQMYYGGREKAPAGGGGLVERCYGTRRYAPSLAEVAMDA